MRQRGEGFREPWGMALFCLFSLLAMPLGCLLKEADRTCSSDEDCLIGMHCAVGGLCLEGEGLCGDGRDNDRNGSIDCLDPACEGDALCAARDGGPDESFDAALREDRPGEVPSDGPQRVDRPGEEPSDGPQRVDRPGEEPSDGPPRVDWPGEELSGADLLALDVMEEPEDRPRTDVTVAFESCDDSLDNDGDDQIDCADPDCQGISCGPGSSRCEGGECLVEGCQTGLPGYCFIPPGTFLMGAPAEEPGSDISEQPVHDVAITRGFHMKQTEVTQGDYLLLLGVNPSSHTGCDNCPVENVSWSQALEYCNALSAREGKQPCYAGEAFLGLGCEGYRLPTEAEWEYAARAGSSDAFHKGPITVLDGPDPNLDPLAWYVENAKVDSAHITHPVMGKEPNPWGLYDMHGNVSEWVWDWFSVTYYSTSPYEDPTGPETGVDRVSRGGSYDASPRQCRAGFRRMNVPSLERFNLGFRIVRTYLP